MTPTENGWERAAGAKKIGFLSVSRGKTVILVDFEISLPNSVTPPLISEKIVQKGGVNELEFY